MKSWSSRKHPRILRALRAIGCAALFASAIAAEEPAALPPISTPGWKHEELRRFVAPEARQGVAVDTDFVYVISNFAIGKYRKDSGARVALWEGPEHGPVSHLNAGIVRGDRLFCAHSNYPAIPMLSSVEIWDTATMKHVGTHSFGQMDGSLTWLDWHDGKWFACFAHYGGTRAAPGRDPSWTQVIAFDDQWRRLEGWALPADLVARLAVRGYTCSGGGFGPGGFLYATGHDAKELYVLELPEAGTSLKWIATVPIAAEGQAFSWDPKNPAHLYTILKRTHEVIVERIHRPAA